ncbi:FAD-dependent monooxygenase [Catellatospora coxensis]|uniref:FAD-dependent oxidoreductase n=1 Tax=Catellatospora coxensis TaxID=310354 RepID=A0A8J3L0R7_9ACTN|nr:FAD-dependent monooxygenase [Catellatospora coxensis]GIG10370.1 FAD-dependent oxidoreductase [Catellatospora coxensis]
MDADVVISGGGPTGLLLAAELRLGGVRVVVLERRAEPDPVPRANGLVGQVVTVLYRRGLHRVLARHGSGPRALVQRWFTGAYGDRPRPVRAFSHAGFRLDLRRLRDANPLHVLAVPQRRMEETFERHARALGAEVRRGHAFSGLAQDGDGVTVEVDGPDGPYRLRAAYLVGCDGSHSAVRKAAGIGFPGETSREVVIRMAHVVLPRAALTPAGALRAADGTVYRPYQLHRTAHGAFSFASFIPGVHVLSTHEWDAEAPGEQTPMSVGEARASLSRVVGADVPVADPPADGRPWILRRLTDRNNRLADPYRAGRVFVAGDAAHVFAGFGGSNLNLGLQDAVNLAWKLALVARGQAPDALLDTYAAERVPQARRALDRTREQAELMAPGEEVTARRERYAARLREPGFLREVADAVAGLDLPYPMGDGPPLLGRMAPDLRLTHGGRRIRLASLQRAARPLLLDLTGDQALAAAAAPWRDRVDLIDARPRDPGTPPALLIRPDGYVAWAAPAAADPTGLTAALTTWFGPPNPS